MCACCVPVAEVGGEAGEPVAEGPRQGREYQGPRAEPANDQPASQPTPVREPVDQSLKQPPTHLTRNRF